MHAQCKLHLKVMQDIDQSQIKSRMWCVMVLWFHTSMQVSSIHEKVCENVTPTHFNIIKIKFQHEFNLNSQHVCISTHDDARYGLNASLHVLCTMQMLYATKMHLKLHFDTIMHAKQALFYMN